MSVHKDKKTGKWYVSCRYDNWDGARKQKMKRGFETKREAQAWEREFLQIKSSNLDMTFGAFLKLYYNDRKSRIKKNTFFTKSHIIENKILPYFKDRKMSEIKATDIIAWQNKIMSERDENGEPHSPSYLKTIHNQISAIFNHAFFNAWLNGQTNGYSYGELVDIATAAIWQYRDMYLRPDFYANNLEKVTRIIRRDKLWQLYMMQKTNSIHMQKSF